MSTSTHYLDSTRGEVIFNPFKHVDCSNYSSCKTALVALGVIFMIGGVVAAGLLYSHLGCAALSCLSALPIGMALVVLGWPKKESAEKTLTSTPRASQPQEIPDFSRWDVRGDVLYLGSQTDLLTEEEIVRVLNAFNEFGCSRSSALKHLVIYGTADLKLSQVLDFSKLPSLERLILVGGSILPRSPIDRFLYESNHDCDGKKWVLNFNHLDKKDPIVLQKKAHSIKEAMKIKQNMPTVYCVSAPTMASDRNQSTASKTKDIEAEAWVRSSGIVTTLGSEERPLSEQELTRALATTTIKKRSSIVKSLIIYGNNLQLDEDPGIGQLKNLQRLILVGAVIVNHSALDKILLTNQWAGSSLGPLQRVTSSHGNKRWVFNSNHVVLQKEASSIEEAMKIGQNMPTVYCVPTPTMAI